MRPNPDEPEELGAFNLRILRATEPMKADWAGAGKEQANNSSPLRFSGGVDLQNAVSCLLRTLKPAPQILC